MLISLLPRTFETERLAGLGVCEAKTSWVSRDLIGKEEGQLRMALLYRW